MVALVLYFKNRSFDENSKWLNLLLGFLRFLSVSLIAMLLLSPLLKLISTDVKKPIIVVAQDQSESIDRALSGEDSLNYVNKFNKLISDLSADYEVDSYSFSDKTTSDIDYTFNGKLTNISQFVQSVYDNYSHQNLGAVIIASDGIFNEGSNPAYLGAKIKAPLYTLALGDTTPKLDIILKRVFHNKIAYLGDKFTIQADISAQNLMNKRTKLNVFRMEGDNPVKIKELPIRINKEDFFRTEEIILDADRVGVQTYRISIDGISGESSRYNNRKDIYVDVLDARLKILLLANGPHPDITALKQILSINKNYEITTRYIAESNQSLNNFDFVVLHQLPSNTSANFNAILEEMNRKRMPRLFINGAQTDISKFNEVQEVISIKGSNKAMNNVQAVVNGIFNLFVFNENIKTELPKFNPLKSPFGEVTGTSGSQVLLYQKIGKIDTKYPLLAYSEKTGTKVGVLNGEGIWRWKLYDYAENGSTDIIEEVLLKSFQYLAVKEDKRKYRVSALKNIFNENEEIYFDAELYNESYEPINTPEAFLTVINSKGEEFKFTFDKTNKAYNLRAGLFPPGNYRYTSTTNLQGEQLSVDGKFSVRSIQLELYNLTANHTVLKSLAEQNGGNMLYINDLDNLYNNIKENNSVKPVLYQTKKNKLILNLQWILAILILLLIIEWFLRRFYGSY